MTSVIGTVNYQGANFVNVFATRFSENTIGSHVIKDVNITFKLQIRTARIKPETKGKLPVLVNLRIRKLYGLSTELV